MKKIVLVSCVKSKLSRRGKAKDLYISTLFTYKMRYAKSLQPDAIYILSAKYGILELDQEIDPYEKTLNKMGEREKKVWADQVLNDLKQIADLKTDMFIFLAGNNYRKYLLPAMTITHILFEGLTFGQQLSELKRRVG